MKTQSKYYNNDKKFENEEKMYIQKKYIHKSIIIRSNELERKEFMDYAKSKNMSLSKMIKKLIRWRMAKDGIGEYVPPDRPKKWRGNIEDMPINIHEFNRKAV